MAKSVFALHDYLIASGDTSVCEKLNQGIEYQLQHHLVYRLGQDKPITKRILDISFPASYNLNIVELIRFASEAKLLGDPRVSKAMEYLESKRKPDGTWKIDYRYRADGYFVFDRGRNSGEWVSYVLIHALQRKNLR